MWTKQEVLYGSWLGCPAEVSGEDHRCRGHIDLGNIKGYENDIGFVTDNDNDGSSWLLYR